MGVEDLRYMGNTAIREWTGCPPEALERLGVRYDD
jgi:gluconate 2-dehydrogenase gamma chain